MKKQLVQHYSLSFIYRNIDNSNLKLTADVKDIAPCSGCLRKAFNFFSTFTKVIVNINTPTNSRVIMTSWICTSIKKMKLITQFSY